MATKRVIEEDDEDEDEEENDNASLIIFTTSPNKRLVKLCQTVFCRAEFYSSLLERGNFRAKLEVRVGSRGDDDELGGLGLGGVGKPILRLLVEIGRRIERAGLGDGWDGKEGWELVMGRLRDLREVARERFYVWPFKDVRACWRELFREVSLLMVCGIVFWVELGDGGEEDGGQGKGIDERVLDEIVEVVDMALIMAGPPGDDEERENIELVLDLLQEIYEVSLRPRTRNGGEDNGRPRSAKRRKIEGIYDFDDDDEVEMKWTDEFPVVESFVPEIRFPIERHNAIDFHEFEEHMNFPRDEGMGPEPMIITHTLGDWPALNRRPWKSPKYLLSRTIGGRRLVPVELGRSYVDEGWGQRIISFKEFLDGWVLGNGEGASKVLGRGNEKGEEIEIEESGNSTQRIGGIGRGKETGYLAQHDLFAQIPALRADVVIPDYCYTTPPPPHHSSPMAAQHAQLPILDDPLLNAWFGPAGTISPLHTDPYHNILTQIVGRKYIRLYAPRESSKLYPRGKEEGGVDMGNTSEVDVGVWEGWDGDDELKEEVRRRFEGVGEARFVECILEEGEALYIPVGWWHYVRSLSVSFSVSFWWN